MPLSIEYQYAYLGLSGSLEMSTYMLDTMYINWLARIKNAPKDALVSLTVGLERLLKSFPLEALDHGFRCMLAKINREVLRLYIVDDVELQELVSKIPEYADEHNLEMAIAYSATFQTAQQVDLLLTLSNVHRATRGALPLHLEEAPC